MKNSTYRQTGVHSRMQNPKTHDTNSTMNCVNLNKQKTPIQNYYFKLQLVCNRVQKANERIEEEKNQVNGLSYDSAYHK